MLALPGALAFVERCADGGGHVEAGNDVEDGYATALWWPIGVACDVYESG